MQDKEEELKEGDTSKKLRGKKIVRSQLYDAYDKKD